MALHAIGRDEELGAIRAFLADVDQGPRALVLSGEPGIGKTILWEEGVEEAGESFGRVLTCRGVEAEASLSFAGLSDLLGDAFEEAAPSLAAPRRRALEIALRLVEPGDEPLDTHTIGLAVLDVLTAVSERGLVLVALDDLQWLDPSSAGVLQIALRRLGSTPLGLLATLRRAPGVAVSSEFERAFPEERFGQLELRPLSIGALHRLLHERLGLDLTRPELGRMQEATAGNPFFALELGRELVRTDTRPAPGQALRVPESLRELLGGRLARLPAEVVDVLLQVATLARPTVELVGATYGDPERVLEALEAAVREGVVELEDSRIRFVHPLVASICYEQAPVWKRRAVHRALASAVSDVEERARHLALAAEGPDAAVAAELERAAEQAAGRGAPTAAAELCELAAELTPDEPAESRRRRLLAARFLRVAGDVDRTVAILRRLRDEVPSGVERADIVFELALTQQGSTLELIEQCNEALAACEDDDARASRILTVRAGHHLLEADVGAALADIREALARAERVADPTLVAQAIAYAGQAETYHAEITPGLLERGIEIEEQLGLELEWNFSPRYVLGRRLMRMGETDRARAVLEQVEAEAQERGDEVSREMALWPLAMVEWIAGRWERALAYASVAYELTVHTQHPHAYSWVGRAKALIEADLGLVDEARSTAREALSYSAGSIELYTMLTEAVLGRVELMLGNLELAGENMREIPERLVRGEMNEPTLPVWADAIETLVALGELDRARAYLEHYSRSADRLGSPLAREGVLRCRGLLAAAEGDSEGALAAFDRALAGLPDAPWPFERARTRLSLGVVRRQAQQKRAAREDIEAALATFEDLGARVWAEKARGELRRISGRRAASDELTETEHRVAALAAEGRTNKGIAAELYMGVSTVEAHLSHVYRKLGIRSRAGLAGALADAGAVVNTRGDAGQT
jgi:DNA-binding CsgD family transcriptional regulator